MWSSPRARPAPLPAQRPAVVARGRRLGNSTQAERGLCREALWPRVLAVRLVCARSRSRWTVLPIARSPITAGQPRRVAPTVQPATGSQVEIHVAGSRPRPKDRDASPPSVSYRTERPFDSRFCPKRHQRPCFTACKRILSPMLASIRLSEHRRIRQSDLNPLAVERMDGHVLLAEPDGRLRHGIVSLPF